MIGRALLKPSLIITLLTAAIMVAPPLALHAQQPESEAVLIQRGSPNATTTIDDSYLPPQSAPFGGDINLNAPIPRLIGRRVSLPRKALRTSC